MGGRNSRPHRVLRIRYRSSDKGERKIRSCMVFGDAGRVRKRRRGSKVLRICKVTDEELLHVGEHSPLNASGREVDLLLGRDMLDYKTMEVRSNERGSANRFRNVGQEA